MNISDKTTYLSNFHIPIQTIIIYLKYTILTGKGINSKTKQISERCLGNKSQLGQVVMKIERNYSSFVFFFFLGVAYYARETLPLPPTCLQQTSETHIFLTSTRMTRTMAIAVGNNILYCLFDDL